MQTASPYPSQEPGLLPSTSSAESEPPSETNVILTELDEKARLKVEVVQSLLEPYDRATYGERLQADAQKLGVDKRTVQRLMKRWQEEGLAGITRSSRADKGQHRMSEELEKFIVDTYKNGNKGSTKLIPKQVYLRAKNKATELGEEPPSYRTVLRVLQPEIERIKNNKNIRSPGWKGGTTLSLKTREGSAIQVEHSNQVWQCDHTRVDVRLVDQYGKVLDRPWLTTVIDTYSRCILGINLGFDAPSSQVVALTLRHAILPKRYGAEYKLEHEWGAWGKPEYFYTDGGKDFRSNHLEQIAAQLGFTTHLRSRPSEGGIVERPL